LPIILTLTAVAAALSFSASPAGATGRVGHTDIHAYRYIARHGNLDDVIRTQLIQDGEYYHPRTVIQGNGEGLLKRGERFSLDLMEKRGFVSPEQREFFAAIGQKLEPEQIQFYEYLRWYRALDAQHEFGDFKDLVSEYLPPTDEGMVVSLRRAFMWSVSGQILNPAYRPSQSPQWLRKKLPIEHGPHFGELAKWPFETDDFVFEWGRAGKDQSESEALPRFAQLALAHNLNETINLGGDPRKAWIVVGASDEAHLRLYRDRYKFEEFGQVTGNTLLRRRLTDLLADERFTPRRSFKKVARIAEIAREVRANPTDLATIRFLSNLKTQLKAPLDLEALGTRSAERSPPIWLADRSAFFPEIAHHHLRKMGLGSALQQIAAFLNKQATAVRTTAEFDDRLLEPSIWDRRNSLYVSGLENWTRANPGENPLYPIAAAFRHYLKHLSVLAPPGVPSATIEHSLINALESSQVKITCFIRDPGVTKKLAALGLRLNPEIIPVGWDSDAKAMLRPAARLELRPSELLELEARHFPNDARRIRDAAQLGYWRAVLGLQEDLLL
jgi:hypothetical protein